MRDFRPAQTAAGTAFLLSGVIFGSLAARLPALQSGLGLTDGELALALVALNGGAVAGLPAGAALCDRFGSRRTVRVALPAFACLLPPIAVAPTMPVLAFALAGSAATCSVLDVASNANGVAVERRYGRVVLSRLHAMLTAGGMVGAGIGAAAASARVDVTTHFAAVAAVTAVGAMPLTRRLTADEPRSPGPAAKSGRRRPTRAGWPLGIGGLAFCVTLAEGSGNDWTAVYLHGLGGSGAFAAAGVAVFLGAMTAGRLAGDYLRHRIDAAPLVRGASDPPSGRRSRGLRAVRARPVDHAAAHPRGGRPPRGGAGPVARGDRRPGFDDGVPGQFHRPRPHRRPGDHDGPGHRPVPARRGGRRSRPRRRNSCATRTPGTPAEHPSSSVTNRVG